MQLKTSLRGFPYFAILNLAPLIIINTFFCFYAIVVNAGYAYKRNSYPGLFNSLAHSLSAYVLVGLIQFSVLVGIMGICYWLCKACKRWFQRGIILYLFWAGVVLVAAYAVITMFTGVSMAYVDANAQGKQRMEMDAIIEIVIVFAVSNIFIIPWILFCLKRMKRTMADVFLQW